MNYFNDKFLTIYIIALVGIPILLDFIKKYGEYSKNKDTKVKYLPCIPKLTSPYGWYIVFLIFFVASTLLDIKFYIRIWGLASAINMLYSSILHFLMDCVVFFIAMLFNQIVCGNVILINDEFVVMYGGRINFGEVNCVDVFPTKGILRRRKIDVYVNGKLHTRFSIRDKYTCDIINIFKDRCTII